MFAKNLYNMLSHLAVALVMLFSGLQLWWAVEALQQARRSEAAGESSTTSRSSVSAETLANAEERLL